MAIPSILSPSNFVWQGTASGYNKDIGSEMIMCCLDRNIE